mmetsp:Transcript_26406/g.39033  ORF Transcript_26406/g.39033 Transcript_26406/m.39033 type:complete len:262 (-) Transcript_26406:314-1099(-)
MGQQISRRLAANFEEGLQRARHQMREQVRDEVAKNRKKNAFSDPNATAGFTRGISSNEYQLDEGKIKKSEELNEMSPDLIQFLNDVGPLKREMNKEFTSPRLRKSLLQQVEVERRDQEKDTGRNIREMPILGTEMDHVVTRTTNFSTVDQNDQKEIEKGLTAYQLFELLSGKRPSEDFLFAFSNKREERDEKLKLIELGRNYLQIPVLLKDSKTKEYYGVKSENVKDAGISHSTLQTATGVRLVLSKRADGQETADGEDEV